MLVHIGWVKRVDRVSYFSSYEQDMFSQARNKFSEEIKGQTSLII